MTCTNCRHNREIARLAEEQARLREICSKCRLGEEIAGDGSVSLDAIHDGTVDRVAKVAPNHPTSYTFDPGTIDEQERELTKEEQARNAMHTLLSCLSNIPYDDFAKLMETIFTVRTGEIQFFTREEYEILAHFLNGDTMTEYAESEDETKQTAWARIKKLFTSRPIFKAIANGGLTHGKGGRVATPRPDCQTDFFDKLEGC